MSGVHRSSISSLKAKPVLDPASKQGKLALLLIDIYRAVYALSGGDPKWINYFMNSFNEATKGVPIEQIQSISGLVMVLHFLDAIREER
ncbi:MbcA/ParS/Xre antitoxin family protein [Acinetobacter baumannii]|uniref:MbcA/ParS/Xre antitoxin family protein n=1 Tax=Acinetobacter pittii TaxID=48296 RepID=UPI0024DEB0D9|nr:MbcA/ParS/Xre antitoxin family protein [Acinetobacter pittii]